MLRLSWSKNSYSGHSRIFLVARTMALSASTSYSWSGNTRLTPHMLIRRFKRTMSMASPLMVVFVVSVLVVMMMVARGLGLADAAGELVHQLDELIRRGVVLAGHVAGLDRDGPVFQNRQLHFRLHGQTPFRKRSLFSVFTTFCHPSLRAAWPTISRLYWTRSLFTRVTLAALQVALPCARVATSSPLRCTTSRRPAWTRTCRPRTTAAFCKSARSPAWKSRDTVFT